MTRRELTELVLLTQKGDKSAFEQIYLLTYSPIFNKINTAINNPDDAEDILQDCFVSMLSGLKSLKEPESFEKWFNIIVTNKIKDYKKKKAPILLDENEYNALSNSPEDNYEYLPQEKLEYIDNVDAVRTLVSELSEKNRQTIQMHYFENKSISEIADKLNISENTVKSRLHNGRNEIKRKAGLSAKKIFITILILIIVAIITAVTVSSSSQFFSKILYKFYESYGEFTVESIYRENTPDILNEVYTLSYLPEGFKMLEPDVCKSDEGIKIYMESHEREDDFICFQQNTLSMSGNFSNTDAETETLIINGFKVMHLKNPEYSFYMWDNDEYLFSLDIQGNLTPEEEIRIFEGITKMDKLPDT